MKKRNTANTSNKLALNSERVRVLSAQELTVAAGGAAGYSEHSSKPSCMGLVGN